MNESVLYQLRAFTHYLLLITHYFSPKGAIKKSILFLDELPSAPSPPHPSQSQHQRSFQASAARARGLASRGAARAPQIVSAYFQSTRKQWMCG